MFYCGTSSVARNTFLFTSTLTSTLHSMLNNTEKSGGTSVWTNSGVVSAVENGRIKGLVAASCTGTKDKKLYGS